jgi:hypothetical protein
MPVETMAPPGDRCEAAVAAELCPWPVLIEPNKE